MFTDNATDQVYLLLLLSILVALIARVHLAWTYNCVIKVDDSLNERMNVVRAMLTVAFIAAASL